MADAPDATGVPPMGPHPPVPIVVDDYRLHKLRTAYPSTEQYLWITGKHPFCGFCYDEGVWKQLTARHSREFVKHVVPAVLKPARTLWNEVIGFLFICFAVVFGFKAVRLYLDFSRTTGDEGSANLVRFAMAGFCTVLMLWFGITSFLRARKISRS